MAAENKASANSNSNAGNNNGGKGKKRKYLPHGKPVRKGSYPLHPGVHGFFITCDGGRERQATNEALNLLDTFYEELVHGKTSSTYSRTIPSKPLNKITKFKDSDSSSDEDDSLQPNDQNVEKSAEESEESLAKKQNDQNVEKSAEESEKSLVKEQNDQNVEKSVEESEESPVKKQRVEGDSFNCKSAESDKAKDKCIDDLIEDELKELGDRNKRHFASLDSGCNGVIFIQMHKKDGAPGPSSIVQRMMTSAASTRKHMSRFILRILPAEVACYASEEEITKAIKPLVEHHFPAEPPNPLKFAVLYEARSNTGIERMPIINAVAKSVPQPHKVDLKNPDKTIIVQIVKTICLVGVVEKYKELSKYNLRQLTSPQGSENN
ncbi:tRNA acetyltransferase TAN1 protein [Dioscorea alata]|uniref:tRNA acetyltransferase TAN1 protein n=3 Tax=Dioscorea alata TaxID=55571 RepID=A0ACB7VS00_DIOAL|nr:tRNA acetyltransferase TAN1 protein [Dioscorea alata]KAH7677166.1 tRNA acetyltransferase TAN1 protein [Dioscorea alata]KAH7677167.1 tRNA acetyltransferase TAN1 protein [Dioscorea alata]